MDPLSALDWPAIAAQLDREGYAMLPGLAGADPQLLYPHTLYAHLHPIASRWLGVSAPDDLRVHIDTSTLLPGDFVPLHQDAGVFPLQVVALLSAPGRDFTGGECVLVEQRPRMQSRPVVVPLQCGDAAIIAAGRRPVQGSRGVYTVSMRHAVGTVKCGRRVGQILTWGLP